MAEKRIVLAEKRKGTDGPENGRERQNGGRATAGQKKTATRSTKARGGKEPDYENNIVSANEKKKTSLLGN